MDLRPTNDNENRLGAGSVSDLVWSFFSSDTSMVFSTECPWACGPSMMMKIAFESDILF
jgi:hypothetical protein